VLDKLKYYHRGYLRILPQDHEEVWPLVIKRHRNQNGVHYDLRLFKPDEPRVYSWRLAKLPSDERALIPAYRVADHSVDSLSFQGFIETPKGYGHIKIIETGKAVVHWVDKTGIKFIFNSMNYYLKNVKGKKYLLIRGH